jgi:integrase
MRGSVKQDSRNGSWLYVIDNGTDPASGKRRQIRRRGFRTRKIAEKAMGDVIREAEQGAYVEPSTEALRDYLTTWLKSIKPTVRASTWAGYSQKIESHVKPRIGGISIRALDAPTLNAFYADLLAEGNQNKNGKGLSARTVGHVHKILHRALRDAVRWGKLPSNPADHAEPSRPQQVEMKVWTAAELKTFLDSVAADRLYGIYVLASMTGMRRGEVLALRWVDLDLDAAQVAVRRSSVAVGYEVIDGETKTGRARTVALDPGTVAAMRAHRKTQLEERLAWGELWTDTGLVFTQEDGTAIHPHSLSRFFEHRAKSAGLPTIRFHDLRHTHATLGLAAGVPAKVMQERLGHANVSITLDLYTHVVPGMQEQAAATMGALVFGSVTNP